MDLCIYNRDDSCCHDCDGCIYSKYKNKDDYEDFIFDYMHEEEIIKKYDNMS